mgnify:FL=1
MGFTNALKILTQFVAHLVKIKFQFLMSFRLESTCYDPKGQVHRQIVNVGSSLPVVRELRNIARVVSTFLNLFQI